MQFLQFCKPVDDNSALEFVIPSLTIDTAYRRLVVNLWQYVPIFPDDYDQNEDFFMDSDLMVFFNQDGVRWMKSDEEQFKRFLRSIGFSRRAISLDFSWSIEDTKASYGKDGVGYISIGTAMDIRDAFYNSQDAQALRQVFARTKLAGSSLPFKITNKESADAAKPQVMKHILNDIKENTRLRDEIRFLIDSLRYLGVHWPEFDVIRSSF